MTGLYNWSQKKREAAISIFTLPYFQASLLAISAATAVSVVSCFLVHPFWNGSCEDAIKCSLSPQMRLTPQCTDAQRTDLSPQRSHVTTHAAGLLLRHALNDPSVGGSGLKRVVGGTHLDNEASLSAMLRGGFQQSGVTTFTKWDGQDTDFLGALSRVLKTLTSPEKTWLSSISSEDWNHGLRAKVDEVIARPVGSEISSVASMQGPQV